VKSFAIAVLCALVLGMAWSSAAAYAAAYAAANAAANAMKTKIIEYGISLFVPHGQDSRGVVIR
jgi:hypothetical protein